MKYYLILFLSLVITRVSIATTEGSSLDNAKVSGTWRNNSGLTLTFSAEETFQITRSGIVTIKGKWRLVSPNEIELFDCINNHTKKNLDGSINPEIEKDEIFMRLDSETMIFRKKI